MNNHKTKDVIRKPVKCARYDEIIDKLVLNRDDAVKQFLGSSLSIGDPKTSLTWLSPVTITVDNERSYFHLIYTNCRPDEIKSFDELRVIAVYFDETELKVSKETPIRGELSKLLNSDEKTLIIKLCNSGMANYPYVVSPFDTISYDRHLQVLCKFLGINIKDVRVIDLASEDATHDNNPTKTLNGIAIRQGKTYTSYGKPIYTYDIELERDEWRHYQLFSTKQIEKIGKNNIFMRIDSGCDIGQIYDDNGCDCREQLGTALDRILQLGEGIVVHIPSHDGRGYGIVPKMETEGLKNGVFVMTNKDDNKQFDTISAARKLFGNNFDIRTYQGVGMILKALGIESIQLFTDNKMKIQGITSSGVKLIRIPTESKGNNGAERHLAAKHRCKTIYFSD